MSCTWKIKIIQFASCIFSKGTEEIERILQSIFALYSMSTFFLNIVLYTLMK